MLYAVYAVYCMPYAVQLYTVCRILRYRLAMVRVPHAMLYTVCCILYAVCCTAVYCMLYAVLFTKIMQLPEFMHLRAYFVCVFTGRAANVWGLGMGRARGLKQLGCYLPPDEAARTKMRPAKSRS